MAGTRLCHSPFLLGPEVPCTAVFGARQIVLLPSHRRGEVLRGRTWNCHEDALDMIASRSISAANGCIVWLGAKDANGYGNMSFSKKHWKVHRFVYCATNMVMLPRNTTVMHDCDNPSCINPDHLKSGSFRENSHDMVAKGRSTSGMSLDDAEAAMLLVGNGFTPEYVARLFGVTATAVRTMWRGDSYELAKR